MGSLRFPSPSLAAAASSSRCTASKPLRRKSSSRREALLRKQRASASTAASALTPEEPRPDLSPILLSDKSSETRATPEVSASASAAAPSAPQWHSCKSSRRKVLPAAKAAASSVVPAAPTAHEARRREERPGTAARPPPARPKALWERFSSARPLPPAAAASASTLAVQAEAPIAFADIASERSEPCDAAASASRAALARRLF
mmetsp:Transcript_39771/g.129303  ORF Transcript_39771/g.129303 Transcript_39771/m.129303 type:complete len:204 (+) Transcript_39771:226-837(+)